MIDELMGHQAGRRGEREGSMMGTRFRHMTEAMKARVVDAFAARPKGEGIPVGRPYDSQAAPWHSKPPSTPC